MPAAASERGPAERMAIWCARAAIDATASGLGISALPISVPLVGAARVLGGPGREAVGSVIDGTFPFIGSLVAWALDQLLEASA